MSHKLRERVNEYTCLTLAQDAFDKAPTLSLFTYDARSSIAGLVQRALTVQEEGKPFTLKPGLEDPGTAWWLIRSEFVKSVALTMLTPKAIDGLVMIAIEGLFEKVDA